MAFALLALALGVAWGQTCEQLLQLPTDKDAVKKVSDALLPAASECAGNLLKRGFFEAAATLVKRAKDKNVKVKDEVKWAATELKKKLDRISTLLDVKKEQTASPAFQWAQSSEWLFLDLKFAHRFDAPGCLDIHSLRVNITDAHLTVSASCLNSGEQIKYQLSFDLSAPILTDKSGYKNASVGRVTVNLRKKEPAEWKLPMKGKKPKNMQVWLEMQERTQGELDKFLAERKTKSEL